MKDTGEAMADMTAGLRYKAMVMAQVLGRACLHRNERERREG